jgi:hypothetical protein
MNSNQAKQKKQKSPIRNFLGATLLAGATLMTPQAVNALDIQENGVATVGRVEQIENSIEDAQSYYEAQGYEVPESIVEQYLTQEENGYMPEREVLRAGTEIDLLDLPNLNSYRTENTQQTSAPATESESNGNASLEELVESGNVIEGTVEGTYMIPRGSSDNELELIIKPLEGAKSAVLIDENTGRTYQSQFGHPADQFPQYGSMSGNVAASLLDGEGNDEVEINGIDHYLFRFTTSELRELGIANSVLTVVGYNNPDLLRGEQPDGARAANEVGTEHNKFYFSYNGDTDQVEVRTSEDGTPVQISLGDGSSEPQQEQTEQQNYPTEFGQVVFNYDSQKGILNIEGMGVRDRNGVESIAVGLTDAEGNEVTNLVGDETKETFTLEELTRSGEIYQKGIARDSDLEGLPEGTTEYTLFVTDGLGNVAEKNGEFEIGAAAEQETATQYVEVSARYKDNTVDLSGSVRDPQEIRRGYVTLVEKESGEQVEINPDNNIDPNSIYLNDHVNEEGVLVLDEADFTLSELDTSKSYNVVVHAEDTEGNESEETIPLAFRSGEKTSERYGLYANDGLELHLGTETRFGEKEVMYGATNEQQSTLLNIPETYGQLGVSGRFDVNDNPLTAFNANVMMSYLLGSSEEGLETASGAEINNYLREATDILVQAGYNPQVLDGLVEMAVNGVFGYEHNMTELNETYEFVFNEGGSTIDMTDRRTQDESTTKLGLATGFKVNPLDWLSVGADVSSVWYNGEGSIQNKNLSTINEETTDYSIRGNDTEATANVGLYLGRLADLHDLVLDLSAGYRWNSVERTNSDYVSPLNTQNPSGFVGSAELGYSFNEQFRGSIGYDVQHNNETNQTNHGLSFGFTVNPTNLFENDEE